MLGVKRPLFSRLGKLVRLRVTNVDKRESSPLHSLQEQLQEQQRKDRRASLVDPDCRYGSGTA